MTKLVHATPPKKTLVALAIPVPATVTGKLPVRGPLLTDKPLIVAVGEVYVYFVVLLVPDVPALFVIVRSTIPEPAGTTTVREFAELADQVVAATVPKLIDRMLVKFVPSTVRLPPDGPDDDEILVMAGLSVGVVNTSVSLALRTETPVGVVT